MTEAQKGRSLSRECMLGRRGAGTARSTRGRATWQSAQTTWWSDQRVGVEQGSELDQEGMGRGSEAVHWGRGREMRERREGVEDRKCGVEAGDVWGEGAGGWR